MMVVMVMMVVMMKMVMVMVMKKMTVTVKWSSVLGRPVHPRSLDSAYFLDLNLLMVNDH